MSDKSVTWALDESMYKPSLIKKMYNSYQLALQMMGYFLCLTCRLQLDTETTNFWYFNNLSLPLGRYKKCIDDFF